VGFIKLGIILNFLKIFFLANARKGKEKKEKEQKRKSAKGY
jgi:hypothetical protein